MRQRGPVARMIGRDAYGIFVRQLEGK